MLKAHKLTYQMKKKSNSNYHYSKLNFKLHTVKVSEVTIVLLPCYMSYLDNIAADDDDVMSWYGMLCYCYLDGLVNAYPLYNFHLTNSIRLMFHIS